MTTPTGHGDVHSYSYSSKSYVNALLNTANDKWGDGGAGTGATITYSLPGDESYWSTQSWPTGYGPVSGDGEPWTDYAPLDPSDQAAFVDALNAWAEVANINFVEVDDNESTVGDIRIAYSSLVGEDDNDNTLAWGYYPNPTATAGDIWLNPDYDANYDQTPGGEGFQILLHEIGHTLGLDHSFDGPYKLTGSQDSDQYTVMSYTESPLYGVWTAKPMLYDIAAIQYLYGPNMTTRTGDDVYSYSSSTEVRDAIWDAGGTDRIDASNQSLGAKINLKEGTFSSIGVKEAGGAAQQNVAIAYDVDIENATGGSGADLITGNALKNALSGNGGNDKLKGLDAADTLTGGSGNDVLVGGGGKDLLTGGLNADKLKGGNGSDVFDFNLLTEKGDKIQDFAAGSGGDVVDLSDLLVGYDSGDDAAEFLALRVSGTKTVLEVDIDGGGDAFENFLTFQNLTGLNLNSMISNGNLDLLG
jgi:Ca2+-binding RTX toxin-like protein